MTAKMTLAPSRAHRWARCPASLALERLCPEAAESEAAKEGKAADWVAMEALVGNRVPPGQTAPNDVMVTQQMVEGAELLAETVERTLWREGARVLLQHEVDIGSDASPGIIDVALVYPDGHFSIIDYKFGFRVVEPEHNEQLSLYALGLYRTLLKEGQMSDFDQPVDLIIVQPRAPHRLGPVRKWIPRLKEVWDAATLMLYSGTEALVQIDRGQTPPARPSASACRDCAARFRCDARQSEAYAAYQTYFDPGLQDLSPHGLALQYLQLKEAAALVSGLLEDREAEVESLLRAGVPVPFFALEQKPGRLDWIAPAEEVIALGELSGVDVSKPKDVVTPTQARTLAKAAGLPKDFFDKFAARGPGSTKVVFDDGSKAARIFLPKE